MQRYEQLDRILLEMKQDNPKSIAQTILKSLLEAKGKPVPVPKDLEGVLKVVDELVSRNVLSYTSPLTVKAHSRPYLVAYERIKNEMATKTK